MRMKVHNNVAHLLSLIGRCTWMPHQLPIPGDSSVTAGCVLFAHSVFTHEITVSGGTNWLDDKKENIYGLTVLQEALRAQL